MGKKPQRPRDIVEANAFLADGQRPFIEVFRCLQASRWKSDVAILRRQAIWLDRVADWWEAKNAD